MSNASRLTIPAKTQSAARDPLKLNAQDINEIVLAINDHAGSIDNHFEQLKGSILLVEEGESNKAGAVPVAEANAADLAEKPNVQTYNFDTQSFENCKPGINTLNIPINQFANASTALFGTEVELSNLIAAGTLAVSKVYRINIAHHGYNIDALTNDFSTVVPHLKKAISLILANGEVPLPVLFHSQGINDGITTPEGAATWKAKTLAYIAGVRAVVGFGPVYITRLPAAYGYLNPTIQAIADDSNNFAWAMATPAIASNGQHWNKGEIATIAQNFVQLFNTTVGLLAYRYLSDRVKSLLPANKNLTAETLAYTQAGDNYLVENFFNQLGVIKKSGAPVQLAVGNGFDFVVKQAAGSFDGTAAFSDLLRVFADGNGAQIGNLLLSLTAINKLGPIISCFNAADGTETPMYQAGREVGSEYFKLIAKHYVGGVDYVIRFLGQDALTFHNQTVAVNQTLQIPTLVPGGNPPAGSVFVFFDGTNLKFKDSSGTVKTVQAS